MTLGLLFTIILALLVAGFICFICWLVSVLPFIQAPLSRIVQSIVLFATLVWLLYTVFDAGLAHGKGLFQ